MADKKLDSPVTHRRSGRFGPYGRADADKRVIALDTESDSLFSYFPKVCLIQISVYHGRGA